MANKDPAFLFYASDFVGGTAEMSNEEVGQYIRILCKQKEHGHLSMSQIERVIRCKPSEFVMEKFTQDDDGLFYNLRMEKEINKRKEYSSKQRDRVMKRWGKREENCDIEDTEDIPDGYHGNTTVYTEDIPSIGNININKNKDIKKKSIFVIPTLEEVQAYCQERKNNIDPEVFIDFYESKGWMVGKNKMKDWKATVRTWEKNQKKKTKQNPSEYDYGEKLWSL